MRKYKHCWKIKSYLTWSGLLLSMFLLSCSENESFRSVDVLKVAVLPDQNELQLREKNEPLLDYMGEVTGIKYKLFIPRSYDELLKWFEEKKIDLALFGGVTYVKAHLNSKAYPLVLRDVDGSFRSVALVRSDNKAEKITQLRGSILAFGSMLSTSGHLMPRYFLQQKNIIPEEYFSNVKYSGAHDLTAELVRDGVADLGVANSGIVNEMFLDGRLSKKDIKVIWQSPPFADYVWAIQKDINEQTRSVIRDAFLQMNRTEKGRLLLESLGAKYYIPSCCEDFSDLEEVVLQMDEQKGKQ